MNRGCQEIANSAATGASLHPKLRSPAITTCSVCCKRTPSHHMPKNPSSIYKEILLVPVATGNVHQASIPPSCHVGGWNPCCLRISHSEPLSAKIGGEKWSTTRSNGSPAHRQLQFSLYEGVRNTRIEHDTIMRVVALVRLKRCFD
jgi:hypothetical protein